MEKFLLVFNVHDTNIDEYHKKLDKAERWQLNYLMISWKVDAKDELIDTIE